MAQTPSQRKQTVRGHLKAVFMDSWLNILLLAVPLGILLGALKQNAISVFVINFIAIIPLASLLSKAAGGLSFLVGSGTAALSNAFFGNAVELIISIVALKHHEVLLVQTSLIGSIVTNLLLVTGTSFLLGGLHPQWIRKQQDIDLTVAHSFSGLLILAVGILMIPTIYRALTPGNDVEPAEISRGTSIILLIIYTWCLIFPFRTHSTLLNQGNDDTETPQPYGGDQEVETPGFRKLRVKLLMFLPMRSGTSSAKQDNLTAGACLILLVVSSALVSLCATFLVDTINSLTVATKMSKVFVGLILIPVIGNVDEHYSAVVAAYKDMNDFVIGVAVGSSIQSALFVLPFIVMLGWAMNINSMTLYFDDFQMAIVFVAVLAVICTIRDGKSHWLEGALLIAIYFIVAMATWFYPSPT